MSTRFQHDQFDMTVLCPHCNGAGERTLHAEGHFSYNESFVLASVSENGKEIIPTAAEREAIETKGDSRFPQVQQEEIEHRRECNREMQYEIRSGI